MTLATDQKPLNAPPGSAAARLFAQRDQVLALFVDGVRQSISSARSERHPIIIDTIPAFIDNLAEALAPGYPRAIATEGTTIASEHGGERARLTRYEPCELIHEYQILRDALLTVLDDGAPLSDHERGIVIKSIDQAMSESITTYFLVHEGLREQFTLSLTHDLRNPLSAIRAAAELILRQAEKPDKVQFLAARILENTRRVDRMTHDLLDASRIQFGESLQLEVGKCELLSLVEEVVTEQSTVHGERFELDGEEVHGYWDGDSFKRAVENLLVNAIKYGDPSAPVLVKVSPMHGRVVVSVHNEGAPIPSEEQEALFRSFMRTRTARAGGKKGWGLGLAMVRGMAEGHGGSITVDSAPGRGTTFLIDVPVDSRPYLSKPTTPGTGLPRQ